MQSWKESSIRLDGIFPLDAQELGIIVEQMLQDCIEGVSHNLVNLLKSKPDLFYVLLGSPSVIAYKHTNILNQIISHKNTALLNALLEAGLEGIVKDVLSKSQYNILYNDYPNANLEADKSIATNIKDGQDWNKLLTTLMQKKLLPAEKIDKFSWAIINKPDTLRVAFYTNYFNAPHDEYWEKGLLTQGTSWIMIDFINSVLLNEVSEFKDYCIKDFDQNSQDISALNEKLCFYFPDFLIFHDLSQDLLNLIGYQQKRMKQWLLQRKYKIQKEDLEKRIFQIYKTTQWKNNWTSIHQDYATPWQFLSQNSFVSDSGLLEINSLDYAFLCQSSESYQIIQQILGSTSLLQDYVDHHTPAIVRNFLLAKKLDKNLIEKNKTIKIVKI